MREFGRGTLNEVTETPPYTLYRVQSLWWSSRNSNVIHLSVLVIGFLMI